MAHLIYSSIFLIYKIIFAEILNEILLNTETWLVNFICEWISWYVQFLVTDFWIFVGSILILVLFRFSDLPRTEILIHNSAFGIRFLFYFYSLLIFFSNIETAFLLARLFLARDFLLFLWRIVDIIKIKKLIALISFKCL